MATTDELLFEMQRRVILFNSGTTMPDNINVLGYEGNPNYASTATSGQTLLYNSPRGTHYIELVNGNLWYKQQIPNTWINLTSGTASGTATFSSQNNVVFTTGNQDISGVKNFYSRPTVNGSGVLLIGETGSVALPNTLVYITGDQTISGNKTFDVAPVVSGNKLITGVDLSSYATTANLYATGSILDSKINSLSGYVNSQTTSGQVFNTGSILDSKINSLSGYVNTQDTVFSGQTFNTGSRLDNKINTLSGYTNSQNIILSGQIASSGSNLYNSILSLSGLFTGYTGSLNATFATDAQLFTTGSILDNKINALSGYVSGISAGGSLPATIVYTTGNQTISGTKTFVENTIFGDPSQGDFLVISGNTFTIYGSGNFTSGLFVNGNPVLTGVDLSSYATNANLFITGFTLDNKINALSGYVSGISAGGSLPNTIVYVTGNQVISGVKTFASRPTVNGTGFLLSGDISATILPNTIVYTTGDQIIYGNKTFLNNLQVSGTGIFQDINIINLNELVISGAKIIIGGDSGVHSSSNIYISGNPVLTGINLSSYATSINLGNTGSILDNKINSLSGYVNSQDVVFSGQVFNTGSILDNKINSLSGYIDSRDILFSGQISLTGSTLDNKINSLSGYVNSQTASGQIFNTGSILDNKINSLSGYLNSQDVIFSGQTASTGSNLNNKINSLSGYVNAQDIIFSGQVFNTGSRLDSKINSLSGYVDSKSITLPSTIVYTTGNQTISGTKTFVENTVFGDSSQGDFLVISGNTFTIYGSGNFTNGLFISGVPVLTGVDLNSYATKNNLNLTGSILDNKINALSGYVSGISAGGSLPNSIVYITGNQIISGNKTFINNISVSGTGNFNNVKVSSIDNLFLSGIDIVITGNSSINVYNQIYISGNPVLTEVDLSSYATRINLYTTGSTLDNKINSLSGYVSGISAGGSLPGTIVYVTGDQTISGSKTFASPIVFSSGALGAGGSINLSNGGGSITSVGCLDDNLSVNSGGSIDLSAGGYGSGGSLLLSAAGGDGGTIDLRGGQNNANESGGNITSRGNTGGPGGSLNMSASTEDVGGSINTAGGGAGAGGSINLSNNGGSITSVGEYDVSGGSINLSYAMVDGDQQPGGSINTSGGGSIDTSQGGGSIDTSDGGGSISTAGGGEGGGGSINLSNNGGSIISTGGNDPGGTLNMSAGQNGRPGGSINTNDGGGSIDTRGQGSIQLGYGYDNLRTTLSGSAIGGNRTITLPNADGTLALDSNVAITGSILNNKINSLSGYVNSQDLIFSGQAFNTGSRLDNKINALSGYVNSQDVIFSGQTFNTGSRLDNKINSLSGYVDSKSITLPTTIVYTTGNQTISGNKTFVENVTFGDQTQDNLLVISGNEISFGVYPTINGTGIVYTEGNQTISGVKTFLNKILFGNENGTVGYISGNQYFDGDSSLFITTEGPGANYIYLTAGPSSMNLGEGGFNINAGNEGISIDNLDGAIYINGPDASIYAPTALASFKEVSANNLVYNVNNQIISGVKTFATGIFAPNLVYITGDQTISGIKTFASRPNVNGTGFLLSGEAANITLPNTIVYTTGNQTVSGTKTFANNLEVQGTGIFNALDLSNISEFNFSGTNINLINGNVNISGGTLYISGNAVLTGVNLNAYATTANLFATGSTLDSKINSLSGYVNAQSTSGQVFNTGSTLDNKINVLSGYVNSQDDILSGQIFNTGSRLDNKINSLSPATIVYTTGSQKISGEKYFLGDQSFRGNVSIYSGLAFVKNQSDLTDVDLNVLNRPYSNSYISIGSDTSKIGPSINGSLREVKIWETGGYTAGPWLYKMARFGPLATILSEDSYSRVGIGTLFPTEKVEISGGNLKVDGTGLFNALDLNNIDTLSLSGVDISLTNGNVSLTNRPTVNGTGVVLSGELNPIIVNTGSLLNNKINSLSGYVDSQDVIFSGQTFNTGSRLDNKINALSGYVSGISAGGSLPNTIVYVTGDQVISGVKTFASRPTVNGTGVLLIGEASSAVSISGANFVYTTGDQLISGNKTFLNNITVSGTGLFNSFKASNIDKLVLSGVDVSASNIDKLLLSGVDIATTNIDKLFLSGVDIVITGNSSINVYNNIYISGNQVLTGSVQLSSYATISNLFTTGSTLDNKINSLSGYISGISAGGLLPSTIVYITGNQTISGVKNFTNNLVLQDNLFQSSQPSGYLTGIGYSGNYDGGYFLGRTKLSQNTSRLVDSSFGNNFISKTTNKIWADISASSDAKYQSAVVDNEYIYISSDFGNTWMAKMTDASRAWSSISISSDGKYQTAVVNFGQIYVSSDYGNTWTAKITSAGGGWSSISISSDGKYQSAVAAAGRIYVSSDYGNSWVAKESIRAWNGVSISSDGKYQSAVATAEQIYVSSDYGNTWVAKETNRDWKSISISSDGKYQSAVGINGINVYISSNYGNTWSPKGAVNNYGSISISSDGKYQVSTSFSGLSISTNYGNTWTIKNNTVSSWIKCFVNSDGKYIIAAAHNQAIYVSKTDEQIDGNLYADNLVYNTGNQTISGVKTFIDKISLLGGGYISGYATDGGPWGEGGLLITSPAIGGSTEIDIIQGQGSIKLNNDYGININHNFDINLTTAKSSINLRDYEGDIYLNGITTAKTGTFQKLYADNLVYNTGNQTISGAKTFANTGSFNTLQITNKKLSSYNYINSNFTFGDAHINIVNSSNNVIGILPNSVTSGINYYVKNLNTGVLLITGSNQRTIDGFSNINLYKNESLQLLGVNNIGYTGWISLSVSAGVS